MSASLRFLAMAVIGWAGVRAATLGALPGTEAFTLGREVPPARTAVSAGVPAIVPTEFAPIEPAASEIMQSAFAGALPGTGAPPFGASPVPVPIYYYPVSIPRAASYVPASLHASRSGRLTEIAP